MLVTHSSEDLYGGIKSKYDVHLMLQWSWRLDIHEWLNITVSASLGENVMGQVTTYEFHHGWQLFRMKNQR